MPEDALSADLRDRALGRLGFAAPPTLDLSGLRAVYAAWCRSVPFDNLRKIVALRTDQPLPGADADDFFAGLLADGTGGTCWSSANGLFALLHSLGFDARRAAGAMGDTSPTGVIGHGTVKVRVDGEDWLLDSSAHTDAPLPLDRGYFVHPDPLFAAEVEPVEGGHILWWMLPPRPTPTPCRLRIDDAPYSLYRERYEASRERSPFNRRLYARRNRPGEILALTGNVRISRTVAGVETQTLTPAALSTSLIDEFGMSERVVAAWTACGGREASFEPSSGPPPTLDALPPSLRGA